MLNEGFYNKFTSPSEIDSIVVDILKRFLRVFIRNQLRTCSSGNDLFPSFRVT